MQIQTSQNGVESIKELEGLKEIAYPCSAGVWTVGYGTTKYPDGRKVQRGDKITQEQAEEYLCHDLRQFETQVNRLVQVPLTQNQFDVLVSFAYNVGGSGLQQSTTLRRLNAGDYKGAAKALLWWNKARNPKTNKLEFSQGLHNRRKSEMELFKKQPYQVTMLKATLIPELRPDPNNTPLRNRDLPLPTAYQQHGVDSVEERKGSPAVVTASAGGAIAGTIGITEMVSNAPTVLSFLQNADYRVALVVVGVVIIGGVVYFVRKKWI